MSHFYDGIFIMVLDDETILGMDELSRRVPFLISLDVESIAGGLRGK